MKLSTPTSPKPPQPKAILLIGPPGSTKTTLALQFPDLLLIDCDSNLDGPENFLRHGLPKQKVTAPLPTLSYAIEDVNYTDDGKEVKPEERFDRLLDILKLAKTSTYKTVCVDGLTMIGEYIKFRIYKEQNRAMSMETRDWDKYKAYMWTLVVRMLKNLGRDTILTCHETILTRVNKDNHMIEEVIGYRPTVQGGIADYFSGFFTDSWRLSTSVAPGGLLEVLMETCKTVKSPHCKNSIGLPTTLQNPTYTKLEPYLHPKV